MAYPPRKNQAHTFYHALTSQADPSLLQANPTLAAGDVKVAIDDGAPANVGTLPAVDADFTKRLKVVLSAAEMNGDNISIIFSDAAGAEWTDAFINLQTVTRAIDDLAFPTVAGRAIDVSVGGEVGLDWANVGSPTTVQALSGTTVGTATAVTNGVTVTTNNDKTGYALGVGGIGATAFAAGAVDAAAIAADAIGASELAQGAAQEIADEVLNRNLAGSGSGNTRNVRNALRILRNKVSIAAGTLTVTEEDDTTSAWTGAVTTTAGNPISAIDPA